MFCLSTQCTFLNNTSIYLFFFHSLPRVNTSSFPPQIYLLFDFYDNFKMEIRTHEVLACNHSMTVVVKFKLYISKPCTNSVCPCSAFISCICPQVTPGYGLSLHSLLFHTMKCSQMISPPSMRLFSLLWLANSFKCHLF